MFSPPVWKSDSRLGNAWQVLRFIQRILRVGLWLRGTGPVLALLSLAARIESADYALPVALPVNYSEAARMVEMGEIDRVLWVHLKDFYEMPLSVPSGDLKRLAELFPKSAIGSIPTDTSTLSAYTPWTPARIAKFFSDYPHLAVFRPILQFSPRGKKSGRIDLRTGTFTSSKDPRVVLRASAGAGNWVQGDGALSVEQHSARWYRRKLEFELSENGALHLGNFSFSDDQGLLYGAFSPVHRDSQTVKENWRYGGYAGWNGAQWQHSWNPNFSSILWGHLGQFNKIGGAGFSAQTSFGLRVVAGASLAANHDEVFFADSSLAAYSTVDYLFNDVLVSVSSAVTGRSFGYVPVKATLRKSGDNGSLRLVIRHIPKGFTAPFAQTTTDLADRLSPDDTLGNGHGTSLDLRTSYQPAQWLDLSPHVFYVLNEVSRYARTGVRVSLSRPFHLSIRHSFHPWSRSEPENHRGACVLSFPLGTSGHINPGFDWYVRPGHFARFSTDCSGTWIPIDASRIDYTLRFTVNSRGSRLLDFSLGHELVLSELAVGRLELSAPLDISTKDLAMKPAVSITARFYL